MQTLIICTIIGFLAQMIDGTMGMAYGVSCNTFLRTFAGLPSAVASASVHFAEIFTTLASGISHFKLKNVNKRLFLMLLIPGIIGGVLGAYLLSSFYSEKWDPIIDAYLIIMGVVVLTKIFKKENKVREPGKYVYGLGLIGGFCDAIGGGGWGPVVTSTLVATDHDVKTTIGSVNTAEFFITVAQSATFVFTMKAAFLENMYSILGLIIGGLIAAPFAALMCKKIPIKPLLGIVGGLIILTNVYKLLQHLNMI